ncbi:MAG: gamma-glutamyltransferase, partial [Bdellovibrionia bacterium]
MHRFFYISLVVLLSIHAGAVPFEGQKLVVAGPSPYAVETARKIQRLGGNAADVAVAMGLTLSVTTPYFAALGGGGFAMIKSGDAPVTAIDFREVATSGMSRDYYKDKSSEDGGPAVGVPGFPAGLAAIHKKFGKLPWKSLFGDAIELAEKGFQVSGDWAKQTASNQKRFDANAKKYLFNKDGTPLKPGDILKQPQLARALKLFRDKGEAGFYSGAVAGDVATTVKQGGGALTEADLKAYKVRWLAPLETEFRGHKVYLMPPPSSGGVVLKTALALTDKL